MKYTDQIRKYLCMTSAAVLSACMLFGCTRADIGSSTQNLSNAGGNASQGTVSATTSDNSLAGAGSGSAQSSQSGTAAGQAAGSSSGQTAQSAGTVVGQTAQNVSGKTTQAASQTAAGTAGSGNTSNTANAGAGTAGSVTSNPGTANAGAVDPGTTNAADPANTADPGTAAPSAGQSQSAQIPSQQTQTAGSGAPVSEAMSGEFERSDGEENVVLSIVNDSQISFQFRASGISGTAQADGNTAVYQGDDGYSVTFDAAGDTLAVTVGGEGGSESPMNGIYYRVLDGGDGVGDDGQEEDGEDDVYYTDGDAEAG